MLEWAKTHDQQQQSSSTTGSTTTATSSTPVPIVTLSITIRTMLQVIISLFPYYPIYVELYSSIVTLTELSHSIIITPRNDDLQLQWLEENPKLLDNVPPFIAFPTVDENWGFLSSHFLNRTTGYQMTLALHKPTDRIPKNGQLEEVQSFLDHPKLLMLVTNQHMNITHPKVISLPIGFLGKSVDELWPLARLAAKGHVSLFDLSLIKSSLLLSAASDWGPRPYILQCVQNRMDGDTMHVLSSKLHAKVSRRQYSLHLLSSAAVLCLPGLGYDSYRVFEALLAGAMPVLERGIGLDRSWHKLPVSVIATAAVAVAAIAATTATTIATATTTAASAAAAATIQTIAICPHTQLSYHLTLTLSNISSICIPRSYN